MNSSKPSPTSLPSCLQKDGWWLCDEVVKPTAVILAFPSRKREEAKQSDGLDEIVLLPNSQQADTP
jgi:hypothetical protein